MSSNLLFAPSDLVNSSVTEQPYKTPYYAALLRLLHDPSDVGIPEETPLGRLILEDFWKGFQGYLDKVAWRETRLCVSAQLTNEAQSDSQITRYNFLPI